MRRRPRPDARLHCCIEYLSYDFQAHEGQIHFPGLQCCDMTGCIRLFQGIDRQVRIIQTFDAGGPSTRYALSTDGWIAIPPGRAYREVGLEGRAR